MVRCIVDFESLSGLVRDMDIEERSICPPVGLCNAPLAVIEVAMLLERVSERQETQSCVGRNAGR